MSDSLRLSPLAHTWILDLDGTLVKHNGYLTDGKDTLLPGAAAFLARIPAQDFIVLLTSREEKYRDETLRFLQENHIRYDWIVFGAPYGERILMNDRKPSGLCTGYAVNKDRDSDFFPEIVEDNSL